MKLPPHLEVARALVLETIFDQVAVAGTLRTHAESHGGILIGRASDLHKLGKPLRGWPSSIMEMEKRALPELAAKPGFMGITVRSLGPGLDWEVRIDPKPTIA